MTSRIALRCLASIRPVVPAELREALDALIDRVVQDAPAEPPQNPPQPEPPPDPPPAPAFVIAFLAGVHVGAPAEIQAACDAVVGWVAANG